MKPIFWITPLLALLVSGCGDDSGKPTPPAKPETSLPLTLDVTPQARFEGTIKVSLGRFTDHYKQWRLSAQARDVNGDGHIDERDAQALGIDNEMDPVIEVDAKAMDALLRTNPDGLGAGTARPDIFVEGHYSAFDLLRYLALTRGDLRLDQVTDYRESGLDTYGFRLSWDENGDGLFDERDSESFVSPDWHFRFKFDGGETRRITGSLDGVGPEGEAHYERMDQFWLQPGMTVRFQPFTPEMTARRQWVQQREVERLRSAGNLVIVPELVASFDEGKSYRVLLQEFEVTAHNLRPDIFQPGVITAADTFLSAADQGVDVAMNYWPTVASKAPVGHFALFRLAGTPSRVGAGWTTRFGEKATLGDFAPFSRCDFGADGSDHGVPKVTREACWQDWNTYFGGNMLHLMTDVWVMNQPVEQVHLIFKSHYTIFGMEESNGNLPREWDFSAQGDGSDTATLSTLPLPSDASGAPLLTDSHFGWGIADCESCHNDQPPGGHGGYPWPINSVDGFDNIQPYYCASCHGSNGAPKGHGETARCFWCHSEDQLPQKHGEASAKHWIRGEQNLEGNHHNYRIPASTLPRDRAGNYAPYTEILSTINSDWAMSNSFPDPYSCMTCHPNP